MAKGARWRKPVHRLDLLEEIREAPRYLGLLVGQNRPVRVPFPYTVVSDLNFKQEFAVIPTKERAATGFE
jgi:hypothetical protein